MRNGKKILAFLLTAVMLLAALPAAFAGPPQGDPTHNHEWKVTESVEATCTQAGRKTWKCSTCGTVYMEEYEPKGHKPVNVAAKPATCTESGNTAGQKCSVCGKVLSGLQTIPATGHNWFREEYTAPGCETEGTGKFVCRNCKRWYRETYPAIGHDWDEWQEIQPATASVPGVEERVCRNDASHREQREIPATGQPGEPDGSVYVLKGAAYSYTGYEYSEALKGYMPALDGKGSMNLTWATETPEEGMHYRTVGAFYLDPETQSILNTPPAAGETYYFYETINTYMENHGKIDYTQIDPSLVSCAIGGFTASLHKIVPDESGDGVNLCFAATFGENSPSLLLEVSWAPGEGDGKVAGDTIRERFNLTNTGNVLVAVPARSDSARYEDVIQPNWYLDFGGVTYTVLKPGWTMEWTLLDAVYPADEAAGAVRWSTQVIGYVLIDEEEAGEKVISNSVIIDIPLSGSKGGMDPDLRLTTTAYPAKASYPYAETDSECETVTIDLLLRNTGKVPLYVDSIMSQWGDGLKHPLEVNRVLYPGQSFSDSIQIGILAESLSPDTEGPGIAGTVDVEFFAYGRDKEDNDTILCETARCAHSFTMAAPGPGTWEIPGESELYIWKWVMSEPTLPEGYQAGEQIVYDIQVENAGGVDVSGAVLTDGKLGLSETLPVIPHGTWLSKTGVYTVTEEDVNAGVVVNVAAIEWTDPDSGEEKKDNVQCQVDTTGSTGLLLKKRIESSPANGEFYAEGEEIIFSVTAENNTKTVLYQITVTDPLAEGGSQVLMEITELQPGDKKSETFRYTVTGADVDIGYVTNTATAEYGDDMGIWHFVTSNTVTAETGRVIRFDHINQHKDDNTTTVTPPYPPVFGIRSDIEITKAQDNQPANNSYYTEGETIRYAITVRNTGEVPVDMFLYDSLETKNSGMIGMVNGLAPDASQTVYYEYEVTSADVDATCVVNYALAKWHPQNLWAETVYVSNKVISPTGSRPVPGGHFRPSGKGDSCYRELISVDGFGASYKLHLCAEHAAVEAAARKQAEDPAAGWQEAAVTWREAVDKEYAEYLEAAAGTARATVLNEQLAYFLWLDSYGKQLALLYPDDPDTVARIIAEDLRDRCVDLCYGKHNAPKAPLDSLTRAHATEGTEASANCGRIETNRSGNEIRYELALDAVHAAVEKDVLQLVHGARGGAAVTKAWKRSQQLWQIALDREVNALYKAAGTEERQVIAMARRSLDQLAAARTALLELVYGDSVIVSEKIEYLYKTYAMMLCGK